MYTLRAFAATTAVAAAFVGAAANGSAAAAEHRVANGLPAALAVAPLAPLRAETPSANSASFTDRTGDSGSALDITAVQVSTDDAGHITIKVATPGASTLPPDAVFAIFLDTDQSPVTGDVPLLGIEYLLVVDGADNTYGVARWNGSSFDDVPTPTALVSYSSGLSATLSLSDLGNPVGGLNFWVRVVQGTDPNAAGHYDDAPDSGTYNFQFAPAAPPKIVAVLYQPTPFFPQAGKRFKLAVTGLRLDPPENTGPVTILPQPDTVVCAAKVSGKRLAPVSTDGCTWLLPKNARGKLFTVTVTVTYRGATATFSLVAAKVR
jgi:hypothetical protein